MNDKNIGELRQRLQQAVCVLKIMEFECKDAPSDIIQNYLEIVFDQCNIVSQTCGAMYDTARERECSYNRDSRSPRA